MDTYLYHHVILTWTSSNLSICKAVLPSLFTFHWHPSSVFQISFMIFDMQGVENLLVVSFLNPNSGSRYHALLGNRAYQHECFRLSSCADEDTATLDVRITFVKLKNHVNELAVAETKSSWESVQKCSIARYICPVIEMTSIKDLLSLGRRTLSILTGVITGHLTTRQMQLLNSSSAS